MIHYKTSLKQFIDFSEIENKYNIVLKSKPNLIEPTTDTDICLEIKYEPKRGKVLYIIFRQTDSTKDWLTNFTFYKKPYKHMNKTFFCHAGFIDAYKSVQDTIQVYFKENIIHEVEILGYSLGGALALLCYEDFMYRKETKQPMYDVPIKGMSFGAPRVFSCIWNYRLVKERCKDFIRIENKNDLVTRVPFEVQLFKHVGEYIRLLKRNFYPFLPSSFYHHDPSSYRRGFNDDSRKECNKINPSFKLGWILSVSVNLFILFAIIAIYIVIMKI